MQKLILTITILFLTFNNANTMGDATYSEIQKQRYLENLEEAKKSEEAQIENKKIQDATDFLNKNKEFIGFGNFTDGDSFSYDNNHYKMEGYQSAEKLEVYFDTSFDGRFSKGKSSKFITDSHFALKGQYPELDLEDPEILQLVLDRKKEISNNVLRTFFSDPTKLKYSVVGTNDFGEYIVKTFHTELGDLGEYANSRGAGTVVYKDADQIMKEFGARYVGDDFYKLGNQPEFYTYEQLVDRKNRLFGTKIDPNGNLVSYVAKNNKDLQNDKKIFKYVNSSNEKYHAGLVERRDKTSLEKYVRNTSILKSEYILLEKVPTEILKLLPTGITTEALEKRILLDKNKKKEIIAKKATLNGFSQDIDTSFSLIKNNSGEDIPLLAKLFGIKESSFQADDANAFRTILNNTKLSGEFYKKHYGNGNVYKKDIAQINPQMTDSISNILLLNHLYTNKDKIDYSSIWGGESLDFTGNVKDIREATTYVYKKLALITRETNKHNKNTFNKNKIKSIGDLSELSIWNSITGRLFKRLKTVKDILDKKNK